MADMPTWGEIAIILGLGGGAITWADNRFGLPAKYKKLEKRVADAEAEVQKAQRAADTAISEKNNEINLIREDRDQWRERAIYSQDQAQHLETLHATKEGQR